ncbi:heavy metal translocating P-type ATPase [Protaetiibacter mangrovi]|uniref:Heavy metal translocating P-type ATPase n=1 Tax=Protaetiibacter mangrovi TaxID=2970926 RepID=A0ABT1ZFA0_9MICO|nr:heavy metal translocating P-type ATPase [Protaetiibacter mangrovi]MCS0499385.1 heavy metal translocating P-type ATPase [Protaetiibacter mangrovi]
MRAVLRAARRYWAVTLTLVIGGIGGVLALAGAGAAVQYLFSAYALAIALWQAVVMVRRLLRREFGLDVLAIMAIVATVVVGEFVAALVVVLMLMGGEALEDFANRRAKHELDALLARAPHSAHVQRGDRFEEVPVDEVAIGEVLLIRPAEVVPVDGTLLAAHASVDESSLTGESVPVEKVRGELLLSGSVNGPEAVELRATATAAASQYQQIVALVSEAAASRAPVVRLADRFAVPFTAFSLALAGVAWAVSADPARFAEVLVLATPCPLLIAAPVAFVGGMSRAARGGLIVKGGSVLEQLAAARTAVFDKTGTLTHGAPEITEVRTASGADADELLTVVASAEQYSSHVLAASLIRSATARGLTLREAEDAREVATDGVEATLDGRAVVLGKFAFVAAHAPDAVRTRIAPGELAIYAAVDGRYAGAILARDTVRANARRTLERLAALGVRRTLMLTGDARETAEHVAAEVGIAEVRAECLPADKVSTVRGIAERPVIMVGDGVNDAPVLASAEVGVAMGAKGATAASESADVVVLVDDIGRVADAVEIGRRTVAVALQSIWVGIAVSIGLMVVASFGVIPATLGALLQEVVDLITILAALRALGPRRERTGSADAELGERALDRRG